MKHRLWTGVAALVLLAGCGGGAGQTSTATTPPTSVAAAPEATAEIVVPTMVITPTAEVPTPTVNTPTAEATPTMMDMTAEATSDVMDVTAVAAVDITDVTAEATTSTMDSTAAPAADGGDSDARQVILDAMRKQLTGGPFRSDTTIESNGQTYTIQSAIVPPNRMQATSSFGGTVTDVIIVEDKMWTKAGDQWVESPGGGGPVTQMMNEMVTNPDANGLKIDNAQAAGTEDVNGINAAVYTYRSAYTTEGQTITTSGKMWIDTATDRPIKLEGAGEFAGVESKTTQVITYDNSITIEPPTE